MIKKDQVKLSKQNKWFPFALNTNIWDKCNTTIISVSSFLSVNLNKIKTEETLTDRVIEFYSSILIAPEVHFYAITKSDLINLNLTDVHLLQKYHYLQYLDLSHNNLSDLSSLSRLPYLLYLNVSHNKLKDISNFAPPRYLTYLNLSHNSITSMKSLENFWSIVNLDLSYNFIKKIPRLHNFRYFSIVLEISKSFA
ncbi:hypothetical protein G9C98_007327 [Cotesia typhae]|uniref:Uncharacterized protein n=1 Tax=Cotesia typhae TaxID=2053667 RepID=A0A8J5R0W3_9HYME|nr:hypothetical protein G9C98_007327 [Cotesia typhae]